MIRNHMVDAIVSTGANIVDQDFFEAIGLQALHRRRAFKSALDDDKLRDLHDRPHLRHADRRRRTAHLRRDEHKITDELEPRPYSRANSSARWARICRKHGKTADSIVLEAYKQDVPIFCPAFSDCSAGFGLVAHQRGRGDGKPEVSIDSAKDFYELTQLKIKNQENGPVHDRRRRAEEFRAGHRRRGGNARRTKRRCTSMPSRSPSPTCATAPLRQHAEGSQQLGQSGYRLRADGLQRSDDGGAADRRVRIPQARLGEGRTSRKWSWRWTRIRCERTRVYDSSTCPGCRRYRCRSIHRDRSPVLW